MPLSKEVRLLENKWKSGQGWPKRLEWIEIEGLRGWKGERLTFDFPITALVGENGVGKSTVLQAVAASYSAGDETFFPSDFFPDTPWEQVRDTEIRACVKEGNSGSVQTSVRKPTERWRGHDERKVRPVLYVDLRRIQPFVARTGYAKMAKREVKETGSTPLETGVVDRLSNIMGRRYDLAKLSKTDAGERTVTVLSKAGDWYSGFHGGAGETVVAELLQKKIPKYSIVIIDEIETSLHPRTQRRIIRDLATICRTNEVQCVLSTHSPYVLDELPPEGRLYLMDAGFQKKIIAGVSPAFAMTKMDDEVYPEGDVYVEDDRSGALLNEIIARSSHKDLVLRYQIVPYGAASTGRALGGMAKERRFPRPTIVFLDGDQVEMEGCVLLPGEDSPERVVFEELLSAGLDGLAGRLSRSASDTFEACKAATLVSDHHEWVGLAADRLKVPGDVLWQGMCAEWCVRCCASEVADKLGEAILQTIIDYGGSRHTQRSQILVQAPLFQAGRPSTGSSNG